MCKKCDLLYPKVSIKDKIKRWLKNDFDGNGINDYYEGN